MGVYTVRRNCLDGSSNTGKVVAGPPDLIKPRTFTLAFALEL